MMRVAQTQAVQAVQAVVLDAGRVTLARAEQVRAAGLKMVFGGRSAADIRRLLCYRPAAIEVDNVGRLQAILNDAR